MQSEVKEVISKIALDTATQKLNFITGFSKEKSKL